MKKNGQSLIEILIALTIVVTVMMSIVTAVVTAQKGAEVSRNKSRATFLAQAGLEWIRAQRSRQGWSTIDGLADNTYCLNSFPVTLVSLTLGACSQGEFVEGIYVRELVITNVNDTDTEAKVTIKWGKDSIVNVATIFSNWEGESL